MTLRPTDGIYRLSFMQQGLLFHSLADPEAAFYVDQVVYTLSGPLDVDRLTRAWQRAVERHETLRTSFHWEGIDFATKKLNNVWLGVDSRDRWGEVWLTP